MRSLDIELAVVDLFDERKQLIIPNVSWGFGINYEADLMVTNGSGYLYEIEIKTSRSDMRADLKKAVQHNCRYVKRLYFAFPEKLLEYAGEILPDDVGLIAVYLRRDDSPKAIIKRKPKDRKDAQKMDLRKQYDLARLGALRIWNLKRQIWSKNPKFKQVEINFKPDIFDQI